MISHTTSDNWMGVLSSAFGPLDIAGASVTHGAFHTVIVLPAAKMVARFIDGPKHHQRALIEHRQADICSQLSLPLSIPKTRSEPVSQNSGSAYLLDLLPGDTRHDVSPSPELAQHLVELMNTIHQHRPPRGLRPVLGWAGGQAWPATIDALTHRFDRDLRLLARSTVAEALTLLHDGDDVLVHGDFGVHNLLWQQETPTALLDFDSACIASRIVDIAPLVGAFGAQTLTRFLPTDTVERACRYRASLPLQVAAAAHLVGDYLLRDAALTNFCQRAQQHTLWDPFA
ncbi:MAG: aminoglycoside phosphotransferase family protein [Propionibacteriaceae bacterium]